MLTVGSDCKMCKARRKMQSKYIEQIIELYEEDFHIVQSPLLEEEVRGIARLTTFGNTLFADS